MCAIYKKVPNRCTRWRGQNGGTRKLAENLQASPLNPYMKVIQLMPFLAKSISKDSTVPLISYCLHSVRYTLTIGKVCTVEGEYEYWHYLCDGVDDRCVHPDQCSGSGVRSGSVSF